MQKIKSVLHRDTVTHPETNQNVNGRDMAHVGKTGVPIDPMPGNLAGTVLPNSQNSATTATSSSNGIIDDNLTLPQYMQSTHHKVLISLIFYFFIKLTDVISSSTHHIDLDPGL